MVLKTEQWLDIESPYRRKLSWISDELHLADVGIKDKQQSRADVLEVLRTMVD